MRAIPHTLSQQLVRSTLNHIDRSTNMPRHFVMSTNTPSQQGMRSNVIPSQDLVILVLTERLRPTDVARRFIERRGGQTPPSC